MSFMNFSVFITDDYRRHRHKIKRNYTRRVFDQVESRVE